MDEQRIRNALFVALAQRDARDEDESLHVHVFQRVIDGVRIPVSVLADADVHQGFPGAHALQFLVTYPHVFTPRIEETVDVVIDLLLDVQIGGIADFEVSVGQ